MSGETLEISLGGEGTASSISLNGTPLLVAGGGDGNEPNYLDPQAEAIDVEEPGLPNEGTAANGWVFIEWYDRRDPIVIVNPLPEAIIDIFDSEKIGLEYTGTWQSWTVPTDVERVGFELWGGRGKSAEPHGHVLAGLDVTPGDTFNIWVGGPGADTSVIRNGEWLVMAAGGDSERPNYVFPPASSYFAAFEGGGIDSHAASGRATIHFWPESEKATSGSQSTSWLQTASGSPWFPTEQQAEPDCIVPRLKDKTLRAAREALLRANCKLGSVTRRPSRASKRRRVMTQSPPLGTVIAARSAVAITVGKRP